MPRLAAFLNGTKISDVELDASKELVIGRASHCDIVLDHPEVSRQHVKIQFNGKNWTGQVLSKYGRVRLNGGSVESFELSDGLAFSIPPFEMRFEMSDDTNVIEKKPTKSEVEEAIDKTNVGNIELKSVLLRLDSQDQPTEEITLGEGAIEAGRSRSCTIPLAEATASRRQFLLQFSGAGFVIQNLGSQLPTLVNGQPITTHKLQGGDVISVGSDRFRFELLNPVFESLLPATIPSPTNQPSVMKIPAQPGWNSQQVLKQVSGSQRKYMVVGGGALIIVLLLVFVDDKKASQRTPAATSQAAPLNAEKFTAEQKKFLEETYNLALNLYTSGKYEFAAAELEKIFQITPQYKDAQTILGYCQQAIELNQKKTEQERLQRQEQETQAKVKEILDQCESLYNSKKYDQVEACISQTSELDPENARARELNLNTKLQMDSVEQQQQARAERERLRRIAAQTFANAEQAARSGRYPAAIAQYNRVLNLNFVDSDGLKAKSSAGVKNAKTRISETTKVLVDQGRSALESKDYKTALVKLADALKLQPENGDAQIYQERARREVNDVMRNLYQESVIEEDLGKIDEAKKKWRTIIEMSFKTNDYYQKAKLKLGKYEK